MRQPCFNIVISTGINQRRRPSPKHPRNGRMIWARNRLRSLSRRWQSIAKLFELLPILRWDFFFFLFFLNWCRAYSQELYVQTVLRLYNAVYLKAVASKSDEFYWAFCLMWAQSAYSCIFLELFRRWLVK